MNRPQRNVPTQHADPGRESRRRAALDAAERSGIREGLPPVTPEARAIASRYATGELTVDQAVAEVVALHREDGGT